MRVGTCTCNAYKSVRGSWYVLAQALRYVCMYCVCVRSHAHVRACLHAGVWAYLAYASFRGLRGTRAFGQLTVGVRPTARTTQWVDRILESNGGLEITEPRKWRVVDVARSPVPEERTVTSSTECTST